MEESTNLSVKDLISLRQIIDIACSRGAFQAKEMSSVGAVYEKLDSFLNQVVATAETQANAIPQSQGEKND